MTCKGEILDFQSKENEVNKNNKLASESLHLTNHQVRQRAMVVRLGEYVLKPAVVSYYESATKRRKFNKEISTTNKLRVVYTERNKYNKMEKTLAFRL